MKISKLFHWLYAFLMLLPVFFVLGKGLYVTFNQNAKDSYYGETINNVISIQLDNLNDLIPNNIYNFYGQTIIPTTTFSESNTSFYCEYIIYNGTTYENSKFGFYRSVGDDYILVYLRETDTNTRIASGNINTFHFEFKYINSIISEQNFDLLKTNFYINHYNKFSYLDNAISYGMYELNECVLFSWAKDSFLSAPIKYISNLFGMPFDSSILTALSYWLDISLIWLTFDVIMYVPLLVHRWLDKGVIE